MDDVTLVRLACSGDLTALARLFERHRPRLLAIGRGALGDGDAAAEIVQETALVALTHLQQLRDPALVGAWLAGIARNLCRRRLRPRAYQEWSWDAIHGGRVPRDLPDAAPTPDDVAVRDDVAARVAGAVDKLPDGQREAVHMFTSTI